MLLPPPPPQPLLFSLSTAVVGGVSGGCDNGVRVNLGTPAPDVALGDGVTDGLCTTDVSAPILDNDDMLEDLVFALSGGVSCPSLADSVSFITRGASDSVDVTVVAGMKRCVGPEDEQGSIFF